MTAPAPRCPCGVLMHDGRLVTYEPFNNGYRVLVVGTGEPVGVTPDLRRAIEADEDKRNHKESGTDG
ncbi:MAG: hypothetical protein ACPHN2_08915 [Sinimarinibacterium flocculans]|uniref:hypothetical protein n=1 Tax=Sinimarinibacterium flocculans TaxID=985250 RepID=UPI003C678C66